MGFLNPTSFDTSSSNIACDRMTDKCMELVEKSNF